MKKAVFAAGPKVEIPNNPIRESGPREAALLTSQCPALLTRTSPESARSKIQSRHIIFEDWSLVENGIASDPTDAGGLTLLNLFPTQTSVFVHVFVLVCYVTQPPPKPWPITVAGLPVFITDNKDELPFDFGKVGWGDHALQHLDARSGLTREITQSIFGHFA